MCRLLLTPEVAKGIHASVNWVTIESYNGLSPARCQSITKTDTEVLSIRPKGMVYFNEILIEMQAFKFK